MLKLPPQLKMLLKTPLEMLPMMKPSSLLKQELLLLLLLRPSLRPLTWRVMPVSPGAVLSLLVVPVSPGAVLSLLVVQGLLRWAASHS
jgi:hypothetical protein